jgi:uncharacterized SAM-binding protein YcdF (DUF218 family)
VGAAIARTGGTGTVISCRRKLIRAALILAGALCLFLFAIWLLRVPLLTLAGRMLVENDAPKPADAILVLGGDDSGTRIIKAAQLAKQGYSPYVLVSGPPDLLGHDSDGTIAFAERNGYPGSLFRPIWLPVGTDSTRSEATFLGNYLREHGIKNILLVTSNYHTRRAARLWRKQAPWIEVTAIAASDPYFTPDGWWKTRSGQKTFLLEWTKTVAAWLGD